jgi:hypothetical protein
VFPIDLLYLPPSIKPVDRLIRLPVFGHGSGPMQQVYNESEADHDRVEITTHRDRRNRFLTTPVICSVLPRRPHDRGY